MDSTLASSSSNPTKGGAIQPLSCTHCRQRKVKCNRIYPCNHCTRLQLECYFPTRKRSIRRRPRRQDELLGRLARLEEIVGKVGSASTNLEQQAGATDTSSSLGDPQETRETTKPPKEKKPRDQNDPSNPAMRYLSRDFWTNLCSEVEGLKQALEQPSEDDDDDEGEEESTPGSNLSSVHPQSGSTDTPPGSHTLLSSGHVSSAPLPHPSPKDILFLSSIYFSHVDLVLKILHRPTTQALMEKFATSPESAALDKAQEALLFAIYFGAVTSISNQVCQANLGEERSILLNRFRLATEMALARADYLTSLRLEPLQAFMIYVACLRVENQGRASWALLGLAVRLAQALNLHRDGDGSMLSPFEAELRRRIWWQLIVLDVRAVEDRGSEAIISSESYNTRMLTNINDDDFGPDTTEPLTDREGPTDVTFCLCTAKCSGLFLYACDPSGRFTKHPRQQPVPGPQSEEEIIRNVQHLESLFIEQADPAHLPSTLAARTVRLIILKLWLSAQYPVMIRAAPLTTRVSHEDMLRTAVAVMELVEVSAKAPLSERYYWWTATYVQWHPLAVALAELCSQSQGELAERAWRVVEVVYPKWSEMVADSKRGALWRPIRKLYKKAKAARLESSMKGLGLGQDVNYKVLAPGFENTREDVSAMDVDRRGKEVVRPGTGSVSASGSEKHSIGETVENIMNEMDLMGDFHSMPSPSKYLYQDPMEWLAPAFGQADVRAFPQEAMDWSTWNEFVLDTNNGSEFPLPPVTEGM